MEVAASKVKSKPVMLENGVADVVQWTLATAAANKLNVLRSFAHGVDSSFPLQIKAGVPSDMLSWPCAGGQCFPLLHSPDLPYPLAVHTAQRVDNWA